MRRAVLYLVGSLLLAVVLFLVGVWVLYHVPFGDWATLVGPLVGIVAGIPAAIGIGYFGGVLISRMDDEDA